MMFVGVAGWSVCSEDAFNGTLAVFTSSTSGKLVGARCCEGQACYSSVLSKRLSAVLLG